MSAAKPKNKSTSKKFRNLGHFILEKLIEAGDAYIDIFFPPGYPGTGLARSFLSERWYYNSPSRESISAVLTKLQKQGLVKRKGSRRYASWHVTLEGRKMAKRYRDRAEQEYQIPIYEKCREDGVIRLITFDIPERERKKRDWLRECLGGIEFRQLQKSVWVGRAPLPEDFLEDLKEKNIFKYVHIVGVKDSGTIVGG